MLASIVLFAGSLSGCGGGSSSQDGSSNTPPLTTKTTIRFDTGRNGKMGQQAIPQEVHSVDFIINGVSMNTIAKTVIITSQPEVSETFDVPNGGNRKVVVKARDVSNNVIRVGRQTVPRLSGTPLDIIIQMNMPTCDISGEWGSVDNENISATLLQSTGSNAISGTWVNSKSGCSYEGVGTFDRNSKDFSITFTTTTGMDPNLCCRSFSYVGSLLDDCTSMSFNWTNDCNFVSERVY